MYTTDNILKRDGYKCVRCGSRTDLQLHHKEPRAEGGSNAPSNLVTLCVTCHAKMKGRGHAGLKGLAKDRTGQVRIGCWDSGLAEFKTRKDHFCRGCSERIKKGALAYGYGYSSGRLCGKCVDEYRSRTQAARERAERDRAEAKKHGESICFIATVVFASPDKAPVRRLRRFRDERLREMLAGRFLITLYRVLGPLAAAVVGRSETLRRVFRRLFVSLCWRFLRQNH